MDHLLPKGGGGPPTGDGAFERFLSAAIATIITIIFSWRMVDKLNEDAASCNSHSSGRSSSNSSSYNNSNSSSNRKHRHGSGDDTSRFTSSAASLSSSFSSPSQLSSSDTSRIPTVAKTSSSSSAAASSLSSLSSFSSSLFSRALPFTPFSSERQQQQAESSSANLQSPSLSPSSSSSPTSSSSSSSSRRQLPPIPANPILTDHQQRLLNERISSSSVSPTSRYRKHQISPERGSSNSGIAYKLTKLKPIIRVPVDLPLCGDNDGDDDDDDDENNNLDNHSTSPNGSKNSSSDVTMKDISRPSSSRQNNNQSSLVNLGNSPKSHHYHYSPPSPDSTSMDSKNSSTGLGTIRLSDSGECRDGRGREGAAIDPQSSQTGMRCDGGAGVGAGAGDNEEDKLMKVDEGKHDTGVVLAEEETQHDRSGVVDGMCCSSESSNIPRSALCAATVYPSKIDVLKTCRGDTASTDSDRRFVKTHHSDSNNDYGDRNDHIESAMESSSSSTSCAVGGLKRSSFWSRNRSLCEDNDDNDGENNDDEDDDDVREELREIESAFGITEAFQSSYSSERNSSRGVIEAAETDKSNVGIGRDRTRSGSGSDHIYYDSSFDEEDDGGVVANEEEFVASASQNLKNYSSDGANPYLNVSWDSVPNSASVYQGSCVDGENNLVRGYDYDVVDLREVSERIRVLSDGRCVVTTDLDDDSVLLPADEDEFYLASSRSRPLGSFGRTKGGGEAFTPYNDINNDNEDDEDDDDDDDDFLDEFDDDVIVHDLDENDFYDDDDQQPRELQSDEELFCCSLLEPIMEEDSEDLSSTCSSSDIDPTSQSPRVLRRLVLRQSQSSLETHRNDSMDVAVVDDSSVGNMDIDIDDTSSSGSNDDDVDGGRSRRRQVSGGGRSTGEAALSPVIITSPSFTPRSANLSLLEQTAPPLLSPGLSSPRSSSPLSPRLSRRASPGRLHSTSSPPNPTAPSMAMDHIHDPNTKHLTSTAFRESPPSVPATASSSSPTVTTAGGGALNQPGTNYLSQQRDNNSNSNSNSSYTTPMQQRAQSQQQTQTATKRSATTATPPTVDSGIKTQPESGKKPRKAIHDSESTSDVNVCVSNDSYTDVAHTTPSGVLDTAAEPSIRDAVSDFDRSVLDRYRIKRPPHPPPPPPSIPNRPPLRPPTPDDYNYLDHIRHHGSSVDGGISRSQQQLQQQGDQSPSPSPSTFRLSRSTGDILDCTEPESHNNPIVCDKARDLNVPPSDGKLTGSPLPSQSTTTPALSKIIESEPTAATRVTDIDFDSDNTGGRAENTTATATTAAATANYSNGNNAVTFHNTTGDSTAGNDSTCDDNRDDNEKERDEDNNTDKTRGVGRRNSGSSRESKNTADLTGRISSRPGISTGENEIAKVTQPQQQLKGNTVEETFTAASPFSVVCSSSSSSNRGGNVIGGGDSSTSSFSPGLPQGQPVSPIKEKGVVTHSIHTDNNNTASRATHSYSGSPSRNGADRCDSPVTEERVDFNSNRNVVKDDSVVCLNSPASSKDGALLWNNECDSSSSGGGGDNDKGSENADGSGVTKGEIDSNSFVQTFSTRIEGDDSCWSNSESDESVQTVITRRLSDNGLTRKLSIDSSSGGSGGATTGCNTNDNSSHNSPSHSSSSSSSSSASSSSAFAPITIRTNPLKTPRRPLSDSLVYQNSKKPKTEDCRDRVVSEGGGLPFDEEECDVDSETASPQQYVNTNVISGDNNPRNNNFDLRAYQSYDNLATFGDNDSLNPNSFGLRNNDQGNAPKLKDRFASGLTDNSEEESGGSGNYNSNNYNNRLRNFSDNSDNSDYQYYPDSDENSGSGFGGYTPGAFYDTDDFVTRPDTTVPVLSWSSGVDYSNNNIDYDLDSGQHDLRPAADFELHSASRLSHIEEEEEEEEGDSVCGDGHDDNIPPSYSEISGYRGGNDSVGVPTGHIDSQGNFQGKGGSEGNTKEPSVFDDGDDVDSVDKCYTVRGSSSSNDKNGGSVQAKGRALVYPLPSVKTVVVSSNPFPGSERTVVISKSGMDNRREYTFGKSGGGGSGGAYGDYRHAPGRDGREGSESENWEEEEEETVTETFIVPESREKVIQRTLQNVKDMLDKKSGKGPDQLEGRRRDDGSYDDDRDVDFDEECQSTCTTTLIDVVSHDAMGFHGNDDERSGYRSAQDAVARTDNELKSKMGFQLDLDEFKVEDYNTESGWPIVRYLEKERAFVDEEGEDRMDNEQENDEDDDDDDDDDDEEDVDMERYERPTHNAVKGGDKFNDDDSDDFRRGGMEFDDNDVEDDDGDEFKNKPGQGFFYPQTERLQRQQSPEDKRRGQRVNDNDDNNDISVGYRNLSTAPDMQYIPNNASKATNREDLGGDYDVSENIPYVHVENSKRPYEQSDAYKERMNIPYKIIENNSPVHQGGEDEFDDEPYKRRDRSNRTWKPKRPVKQPEFSDKNATPYSDRKSYPAQTTPDLKFDDDKLSRGDNMPQSQTRPFHDPERVHIVSTNFPESQSTPQQYATLSHTSKTNPQPNDNKSPSSPMQYAQLEQGSALMSPTVHVPESPTIQLAASEHFPRQLSGAVPLDTSETVRKVDCANLEMGASVKPPPPTPSQKIQEYSSSSEDNSEPCDSRGKPDEGFDSFLRGVPDFSKRDEIGYEEFVRDISDMDDAPPEMEENYSATSATLQPPSTDGILSGNLTSPRKKGNVFVFPKDNAKPGSKSHSSPSYVSGGSAADKDNDNVNVQTNPTPIAEAGSAQDNENTNPREDFPRFGAGARRSSSYSLYDSTGNVLNASFDETEVSGFSLERYNAEPGPNRSRSSDGLNRSKSREGISDDSPRSKSDDLSASADSPSRDPIKPTNVSPSSKLFHSARNVGVSSEPALDVVIESSAVSPQLSPVVPTVGSMLRSEPISIPESPSSRPVHAPIAIEEPLPPATSSATSSGSGSPVRWSRVIAGSSFVPSLDEDTYPAQPLQTTTVSADVQPAQRPSMEPVVIEMSQQPNNSKAVPIFSADSPERRSNYRQPFENKYTSEPSADVRNRTEIDKGPVIVTKIYSASRNVPQKKEPVGDESDDEDSEDDEEMEVETDPISPENYNQIRTSAQLSRSLPSHIGQLRNFSYSLESAEDVYPPDTSSASAVTSPHMSSDSASALEIPTSSSTTTSSHQSRYSSALSPSSKIITTRLISPSSLKGTPWAHSQFIQGTPKKPKSLKEIKKKYKPYKSVLQDTTSTTASASAPRPAPFVLPEQMLTPSRLKNLYSRKKFLSEQNLQSEPKNTLDEFEARKQALLASASNVPSKERRYASNTKPKSMYNSQEQLQRLKDMINSRPTRGRSESSLHECLHDNCILSEHGRRQIIDKTLSIDNMHADIFQNLRRLGSEGDAGAYEDAFFPETSSDLYDLTFPSQEPYSLDRPASMSELHYSTISGSGPDLEPRSTTPSSRHSSGKGRFAGHRQYKKSKSLCTLETNLDDDDDAFATSSMVDTECIKRVPSVHELRISKSLQKLNVPDWYSKSSLSKSGSCLLKYGSSSTMNSFQFSPSLISSPCTTPSSSTNVVIKTRVLPPTSSRNLRSPRFPSTSKSAPTTPSFMDYQDNKGKSSNSVRLPSDKLRNQDKTKALMPIPIVPFDKIRAMFEKKSPPGGKKSSSEAAATKSPNSSASSPPTSPTSPPIIQSSYSSPQQSKPLKTLSFNNGYDDDDNNPEDMPVPRIIVSPTEPHVKGILKKSTPLSTQEKRHSDIQEEFEPVEEPMIVRPIATRPVESSPSLMQTEPPPIPTSAVPERPNKPRLGTVLKEENMLTKEDYTNVNTEAALRLMDDSFSSEDGKKDVSFSSQKEPPKQPPVAKPRGFKFFKSLRSSSSSSSEDIKEPKGRKSPSSSSQKHSPKHQSPNSSFESSGFPASPTRKIDVPEVLSKSPNNSTKGPPAPHQGPVDEINSSSGVRLEAAPVMRPPQQIPAVKSTNLDDPAAQEPIQQPTNAKPVNNSAPTPTKPSSPQAEEPKPEKKRWFPKPKDFRKTKAATETPKPEPVAVKETPAPEIRVDKPHDFEVNEMSYEPRRLRSSRSSDLNDSNVSDLSLDSRSTRQSQQTESNSSRLNRPNARPSDLSLTGRKPSVDSNVSFGKDLDRVADRAFAGDLDRPGRVHDLDRRPNDATARRDKGSRPSIDLDHRSPSAGTSSSDRRDPRKEFDRWEPVRGSERRERPRDFDRREPARHSDRPPRAADARRDREPPINVDSHNRTHSRDNEYRRSADLDRHSVTSGGGGDPRYGSRDYINRDGSRPLARSTDSRGSMTPEDRPRAPGKWQPKPKGSRSSASPARSQEALNYSNGAPPSSYRFPVEGSAFSSHKPNTPAGLNTPPTTSKMNHDVTPSSPEDKSDKSVRETTV